MTSFDWSHKEVTTYDGHTLSSYRTLDELLDDTPPHIMIVGEKTFEAFDLERRAAIIDRIEREGRIFYVTPNRATERERRRLSDDLPRAKRLGLTIGKDDKKKDVVEKTDENDARIIYLLAYERPEILGLPNMPDEEFEDRATAARQARVRQRRTDESPTLAKPIKAALKEFDPVGHGTYAGLISDGVLVSMTIAALHAESRRDFERLAGLSENGHPNIFRADAMYFGLRPKLKAGISRTLWRCSIRWLYHAVTEIGPFELGMDDYAPAEQELLGV